MTNRTDEGYFEGEYDDLTVKYEALRAELAAAQATMVELWNLCAYWETLADGDRHYAAAVRRFVGYPPAAAPAVAQPDETPDCDCPQKPFCPHGDALAAPVPVPEDKQR